MPTEFELSPAATEDARRLIGMALQEDLGVADLKRGLDCTTDAIVPQGMRARADLVARGDGVLAGMAVVKLALDEWAPDIELEILCQDGQAVTRGEVVAQLVGSAHDILTMERTLLNFLGRLSGVATLTQQYVARVAGTKAVVLDTRKTTPGWRRLEKYAVACGGGVNHRLGLYDAVMIKDNHLAFFRSVVEDPDQAIPQAVREARGWIDQHADELPEGIGTILQLEVDTLPQLHKALATDCDMILLDNMSPELLTQAVALRDQANSSILLEASGGVNLSTIAAIAQTGVDRISVGALTHSAVNFDIGLDWRPQVNQQTTGDPE